MPSPAILLNSQPAAMPDPGLFSDKLVSADVAAALPPGYRMRALRRSDYNSGFLECLRVLTTVGDITEEDFQKQYEDMQAQTGSYYIMVIEDAARTENAVVATGALIVERKLYVDPLSKNKGNTRHGSRVLTDSQHPLARKSRPHRRHCCRQGPAGQEAGPTPHPGPRLRRRQCRLLQDHSRL